MVELYRIFEEFQIRKHLKRQPARQVVAKNYQEIESVCLISEAGFLKSDHPLITIQRAFQKEGKKIEIVGFFGESEIPRGLTGSPFFIINKNDITWYGKLKTVVTDKIKAKKYDLVIVYNPNKNYHINYLAMKSKGLLKIGMASNGYDYLYDFCLQPDKEGLSHFIDLTKHYLAQINQK